MKFNYFGKTKIVLAIVMIVITLTYVISMTGGFLKYEENDYQTDEQGQVIMDENDMPIEIINKVESSQLGYLWFPSIHADRLETEMQEYLGDDYEYQINDIATSPVLLFILGIVIVVLAAISLFTKKKILWTVFATIWGIIAVYCYLTNPIVKVAGKIEALAGAGGLITMQTVLAFAGCAVGIAALIISVYAKKKNEKMLLESILKRD